MAPVFFVDRSLGAHIVPEALRSAGWQVVTMRERYGEQIGQSTADPNWILDATRLGEVLLCKDKHIAKRPLEAQAIVRARARAFTMANGEMPGHVMAERLLRMQSAIFRRCEEDGPYVISVAHDHLERLELNDR